MKSKVIVAGLGMMLVSAFAANALIIDASDSGTYTSDGFHNPDPSKWKIPAGIATYSGVRKTYRNFFVYDLPDFDGEVVSGYLYVWNPSGGYSSQDPAETYGLFDVNPDNIPTMMAGGSGLTDIYNDLGEGTQYGQYMADSSDNLSYVTIPLNAAAISAINAASGSSFAMGGSVLTLSGLYSQERFLANGDDNAPNMTRQLVLDIRPGNVPDHASTAALLALALAGMGMLRHRILR